tara:strand:- start:4436 stop:5875 length:1440 start_codon:yes stop_codon:yes gene_type:complete
MRMLDLFSGIGGFHEGFKRAGYEFDWVGYSEIDKYASAVYKYNYKESEELGDIKLIRPGRDLPDNIDILCGGFPCQAFSMAGKRLGFNDTRGTLFFEIARILTHYVENKRPIRCLVLENVKGLLSHDDGRTFATIYRVLNNLGYTIEFQLLNTRWWLPQNRERIYIVGYIGNRGKPQVFPIGENGKAIGSECGSRNAVSCIDASYYKGADGKRTMIQIGTSGMGAKTGLYKVRGGLQKNASEVENCSTALTEAMGKGGGHTPLLIKEATKKVKKVGNIYQSGGENGNVYDTSGVAPTLKSGTTSNKKHGGIGSSNSPKISVPEATKKGYAEAEVGDSINLSVPNSKTRRGRVGKGEAQTLDTGMQQYTIQPKKIEIIGNLKGKDGHECHNVHSAEGIAPAVRENHGKTTMVEAKTQIRRLTPVECMRLQGFSDNHNKYGVMDGKVVEMSDTQRYKQAGNAVTVDVVQAVATIIKEKELT